MESKCKGCTDRQVGCHAQCDDYKKYTAHMIAEKEKIKKWRSKDREYRWHKEKQIEKALRRKK